MAVLVVTKVAGDGCVFVVPIIADRLFLVMCFNADAGVAPKFPKSQ